MKTVYITGTSSGIGKETAKLFQERGWNVIATMRNPGAEKELVKLDNVKVLPCDVTDQKSIVSSINEGVNAFGSIDVLVNNAGFYTLGPFEAVTHEQLRRQIDTNLMGLIEVTKEMIPHFRKQKSGTIINLSSIAGQITIPLQTLYHATKWGVEGFSECLQFELRQFNINVKLIEPGIISTDFLGRSMTLTKDENLTDYKLYVQKVLKNIFENGANGSKPTVVAKTIFRAATDKKRKMRYTTGKLKQLIFLRTILPVKLFNSIMRMVMES